MITRDSDGQIRFHYEQDDDEVASALKNILVNTEAGRDYKKNYNTNATGAADYVKILNGAIAIAGGPMITEDIILHALTLLIDSGEIKPKNITKATPLSEPEEDNAPRDRNGKKLTAQQIQWGEFRRFAEQASMSEINLRKQSDSEFANFVRKSLELEMQEQPVGDAVTPAGQSATKARVNQELVDFARKYVKEPIANLRPKGGFVTLEGEQLPWATFNDLLNKATAAGAIR